MIIPDYLKNIKNTNSLQANLF